MAQSKETWTKKLLKNNTTDSSKIAALPFLNSFNDLFLRGTLLSLSLRICDFYASNPNKAMF